MSIKNKIFSTLGLLLSIGLGYILPIASLWIYMDIAGYSKGWAYDLRDEKSFSTQLGIIELLIVGAVYLGILIPTTRVLSRAGKRMFLFPYFMIIIGFFAFFLVTDFTISEWATEFIPLWKR